MNVANVKEALNLNDANKAITPHTLGLVLRNFNTCPYRIGDILLSVTDEDPAIRFGGKWERLKDRFLLGAGDTYSNGATGGSATHTLSASEIPKHRHSVNLTAANVSLTGTLGNVWSGANNNMNGIVTGKKIHSYRQYTWYADQTNQWADWTIDASHEHTVKGNTGYIGSTNAHNNMPPYLVVYMWKRVA